MDFADPTYDASFEILFANENNQRLLLSLLNSLLNLNGPNQLEEIKLSQQEIPVLLNDYKIPIVDIHCKSFVYDERNEKKNWIL